MSSLPPDVVVVGLGPGDAGLITFETAEHLRTGRVFLRTRVHPTLASLPDSADWPSFDDLYEQLSTFEEIYERIVEALLREAKAAPLVYAVPGHPLFGEATVRRLLQVAAERQISVRVLPAISFVDTMVASLGIDPVEQNLQIIDALELVAVSDAQPFAGGQLPLSPLRPACVAQIYSRPIASQVKLALLRVYPAETIVTILSATGSSEPRIATMPMYEIDHQEVDHLTSLYLPALDPLASDRVTEGLQQIIARLRAPDGCPWDREQTHTSLTVHLIEEAYEVVHAIENEIADDIVEELGDVMLQVLLHAQIAEEAGTFIFEDVVEQLANKLVRRHPHVFGDREINTSGEVVKAWDQIKDRERTDKADSGAVAPFGTIPRSLPALARAQLLLSRAAARGIDSEGLADRVGSALAGETNEDTMKLALNLVALARESGMNGIDAEQALRRWTELFEQVASRASQVGR